jgi:hypothetical protein
MDINNCRKIQNCRKKNVTHVFIDLIIEILTSYFISKTNKKNIVIRMYIANEEDKS